MGVFLHEIFVASRLLRRSPGLAAVAAVTLGVGIALVCTLFAFASAVLLRPLPYRDARRLVALGAALPGKTLSFGEIPTEALDRLRAGSKSFERIGAFQEFETSIDFGTGAF